MLGTTTTTTTTTVGHTNWILSKQGQNCDDACADHGLVCDQTTFHGRPDLIAVVGYGKWLGGGCGGDCGFGRSCGRGAGGL